MCKRLFGIGLLGLLVAFTIIGWPKKTVSLKHKKQMRAQELLSTPLTIQTTNKSAGISQRNRQITNPNNPATLDEKSKQILNSLQNARAGRLHQPQLNEYFHDEEKHLLPQVKEFLKQAGNNEKFNSEEESYRLLILDYLGEKLVGRIATQDHSQILKLLIEHLEKNFLENNAEYKQKQSLVGDQIDIMSYLTRWDDQYALTLLHSYDEMPIHHFLRTGVENGLWLKGFSRAQIAQKFTL